MTDSHAAKVPPASSPEAEQLKADLIDAFAQATKLTVEVQCHTPVKLRKALQKGKDTKVVYDIASTMGLMSKVSNGAVALGFAEPLFLSVIGRMLGEKYDGITTEVEDGCAELLNIVFGQAKKILADRGHAFGKTLPSTFVGTTLRVRQLTPQPATLLPFECEFGTFYVEIGLRA